MRERTKQTKITYSFNRSGRLCLILLFFAFLPAILTAQTTWNGTISTAWENASNWSAGLPSVTVPAIIPAAPTGGRFPTISTGTQSAKDLTINAGAIVTQTGGIFQLGHDWRNSGTYNATAGTVQFTTANGGNGANFSLGTNNFFNVIVNTGIDPGFDVYAGSILNIAGDFTNNNSGLAAQLSNSTFIFNGSGDQNFYSASANAICGTITVNKSSGILYQTSAIKATNLTLTAGTYSTNTGNYDLTLTGNLTLNGGTLNLTAANISVTGSVTNSGSLITGSGFTLTITGDYSRSGNATMSGTGSISLAGNFTNNSSNGSITAGMTLTGTAKTIGGSSQTTFSSLAVTGTITMNTSSTCSLLSIPANASASSLTLASGTILTVNGDVTITQPTASVIASLNINAATCNVTGNINIGGSNTSTGRVSKVIITTGTLNLTGNLVFNSSATTAGTAVLDMSGGAGLMKITGSIVLTNNTGTLTPGTTSTVEFISTTDQNLIDISAINYNTIKVNKSSGTLTLISALSLSGNLQMEQGSLTTSSSNYSIDAVGFILNGGSLNLNNSVITVSGNYTNSGAAVTGGTCSITVNGDYTRNGGSLSASSGTLTVGGNWVNNLSSALLSISSVTFTGTSKTIGGTFTTSFPVLSITTGTITAVKDFSCTSLTLANNNAVNSLTLSTGITATVNGNTVINQSSGGTIVHSLNVNDGTFINSGDLTINVTANNSGRVAKIVITTGTLNITGNLSINNTLLAANAVIDMSGGAGNLNLGGNFSVSTLGTLTPGTSSTFCLNGTGNQVITQASAVTYNNFRINKTSGTASIGAALNINGSLILDQGTFTTTASNYALTTGGLIINGGTFNTNASTLTFNGDVLLTGGIRNWGTSTATLNGNWTNNGGTLTGNPLNLILSGTGNTISGSNTNPYGSLTLTAGSSFTLSNTTSCTSFTINASSTATSFTHTSTGNLTVSGAVTINQPTASSITESWNINSGSAAVTGNINIGGANTTTTRISKIVITTGSLTANGNIVYNSPSATAANAVIDMTGGAGSLYINGSLSLTNGTGTLSPGTSSNQIFGGSLNQTISTASAISFNNIEINKTSGSASLSSALTMNGNIKLTSGTFSNGGNTITFGGNWINNGGTFSANSVNDTIYFIGVSKSIGGSQSTTFPIISIDSNASVTMNVNTTCDKFQFTTSFSSSSFTQSGTTVLTINNGVILRQPSGTASHSWYINSGTANITGTLKLGTGDDFNNASRISNVFITTGTLNANGDITFQANPSHPENAVLDLTGGAATINVKGNVNVSASGWNGRILPGTSSTFNFNGTSAQSIYFVSYLDYYNININNTAGVTLASSPGATDITGDLRVQTGTLNNGGFAVTGNSAKTFEVADGAFFNISGTSAMVSGFGTKTFGAASTVNYNGTSQTVSSETYGNLILSGSGTKTMSSSLTTVQGNFSNTGSVTVAAAGAVNVTGIFWIDLLATYSASSFTLSVKGDFKNDGVFNSQTSTVVLNGTSAQAINGGTATTFNHLTISNTSSAISAPKSMFVNGVLTMNANTIITPTSLVIIGGTGTVTGSGTVQVTRTGGATDFGSQYTITNKTLTNLTVEFIGSAAQTADGFTYGNIKVNNSGNGITLTGSASLNGTLTLTNGRLTLSSFNLTLGTSATVAGTLNASNMIVAAGSGELRKSLNANGSFTFPVGDATGTAEYSPVTLNFTSGTYAGGAYAGVKLSNAKHPNNPSATNYLSRYWTITQSGITAFICSTTFQYVSADVNGTESSIYTGYYNGTSWTAYNQANTTSHQLTAIVTAFGDFTGGDQTFGIYLYRSLISGIWSNAGTWEYSTNGGTSWANASSPPSTTNDSVTISSGHTVDITADVSPKLLTVSSTATLNPSAAILISGNGTLTGNGTVKVTRIAATADFSSQYTITNKTLTNLTVDYAGSAAQSVTGGLSYKNLLISNTSGIVSAASNFTVTGTLTVNSGTVFSPAAAIVITGTGATLTGNGTAQVKMTTGTNNFGTQYAFTTKTLTNLTVEFNGASVQSIDGLAYGSLKLNNANNANLNAASSVNNTLTLSSGLLIIGSYNLTLNSGGLISGSPSASNMIVPVGAGEFRMQVSATGSYTLPVGDNTGTVEYSPLTLNYTAGTFAAGSYLSVRVVNSKHPNNNTTTNYINRYWIYRISGITNSAYTAVCTYTTADVSGTEASIYGGRYRNWTQPNWNTFTAVNTSNHTFTTTSIGDVGDFTGGDATMGIYLFRSITSGNWNAFGSWEYSMDGGSSWITSTNYYPNTSNDTVTVKPGHTINVITDVAPKILTIDTTAILNPSSGNTISGTGTITGKGTAKVTRTAAVADFASQYPITNKILTNLIIDYAGTAAQSVTGGLTYNNLIISNLSAAVTAASNFTVNGFLTISQGAILNPSAAVVISGSGTLNGNGTAQVTNVTGTNVFAAQYALSNLSLSGLTVEFKGASAQIFSTGYSFRYLKINNSAGVTLKNAVTVNDTLNLTSGNLNTDTSKVTMNSSAVLTGEQTNRYVIGKITTSAVVGTGSSSFSNVGVSLAAGDDNLGTVNITRLSGANGLVTIGASSGIKRHWIITSTTAPVSGRTLNLSWVSNDDNSKDLTKAYLFYSTNSGTNWFRIGSQQNVSSNRTITSNVTGFGDYTVSDSVDYLPVEMSSFSSVLKGRNVSLNWITAHEKNNAGFDIERKDSLSNEWKKIGHKNGKGNSDEQTEYKFDDNKLKAGKYNYRLKQSDMNGNIKYYELSNTVTVNIPKAYNLSQNYPNPFNPVTKIDYELPDDSKVTIKIFDITGREIASLVNNEQQDAGYYTVSFNAADLASGIYFYRILAQGEKQFVMAKKMMLVK